MDQTVTETPRFATLQYRVREKLDITWSEYVLLDMVYHLSAKYGFCFKHTASVARDLGQSFNGTKHIINTLLKKGLLVKVQNGFKCSPLFTDIAYLEKRVVDTEIAKSAIGLRNSQRIAKSSDKNNSRKTLDISKSQATALLTVLNDTTGRKFRVLPKQESQETLKQFSLEEIQTALTNLSNDSWHREKMQELSPAYLLRSTTIDKGLNLTVSKRIF